MPHHDTGQQHQGRYCIYPHQDDASLSGFRKRKKNLGRKVWLSSWRGKKLLYGLESSGRERIPHGDLPYNLQRHQFNGPKFPNLSLFNAPQYSTVLA